MAGRTAFKRLLLQGILWDAQENGLRLHDALKAACRAKLKESKSGNFLVGTSGNGKTANFEVPASGRGLNAQEIAEILQCLYELYGFSKDSLIASGITSPNDTQIAAEMRFRLNPVRSYTLDHSASRRGPDRIETEVALV